MKVQHLYISPGHNFYGDSGEGGKNPTVEVPAITCLAGRGIEGDRFLDFKADYKGQITFFADEIYRKLSANFAVHDKSPGVFRRNVITSGVDLNELIGQQFEIDGVKFLGVAECSPCKWMDKAFCPGAEKFLRGNGGLRAKILTDGVVRSANRVGYADLPGAEH